MPPQGSAQFVLGAEHPTHILTASEFTAVSGFVAALKSTAELSATMPLLLFLSVPVTLTALALV
ncbi:MAG: hypothetical protein ACU841_06205, partial [Gammaproteobacteria bacterium]